MGRRLGLRVGIIAYLTRHGNPHQWFRYRNFMMLCAALVDQRMKPGYSPLLNNPTPPSVDNLKVWIEEAWKRGG
jgi:hypothetical protein